MLGLKDHEEPPLPLEERQKARRGGKEGGRERRLTPLQCRGPIMAVFIRVLSLKAGEKGKPLGWGGGSSV